MKKMISEIDFGLLIWQLIMIVVIIVIVFSLLKLYKKLIKYLERNK